MDISITLDYELFFGARTGSAESTLNEPTAALCELAKRHAVPLVFFVDAMWLLRLRELAPRHRELMAEHHRVSSQLEHLVRAGHELQLHLHPHWKDCTWGPDGWDMDLRRYRLHDWSDADIADTVASGAQSLRAFAGADAVRAFRAGGWCVRPFDRLRKPLLDAGIRVDSTVFAGGHQHGGVQAFDFREAPALSRWRFDTDPLLPHSAGAFIELPIASHEVSPTFYWRLAALRTLRLQRHRALGEGAAVALSRDDLVHKLFHRSISVVSIDGYKANFLEQAWRRYRAAGMSDFVVIGHPKAFTRYSLDQLDRFLRRHRNERVVGLGRHSVGSPEGHLANHRPQGAPHGPLPATPAAA